jgi:D-3-phosphoglycerate dehydrogenase / 2-oxoglutarate reductase
MAANTHKVLVVEPFHEDGMRLLRARPDLEIEVIEEPSETEIAAAIAEAEGITLRTARLPARLIDRAPRLRVVCRHGVGYDNVDLAALTARGIPLTITADANAVPVAEQTLYLMLALANQGPLCDRETRRGQWAGLRRSLQRFELEGKRLLIIGFGRIGREVAVRAEAFGMQVVVFDPYVDPQVIGRAGHGHVADFRTVLPETDVLTVHVPMTRETRGMIDAPELAALPERAIVINTARGGIIGEAALIEALRAGRLAGAGLDVFEAEPPAPDNPLFALPNVVLSPHAAGVSRESAVRMAVSVARSVIEGIDGHLDPLVVVNREVLRSPVPR